MDCSDINLAVVRLGAMQRDNLAAVPAIIISRGYWTRLWVRKYVVGNDTQSEGKVALTAGLSRSTVASSMANYPVGKIRISGLTTGLAMILDRQTVDVMALDSILPAALTPLDSR